MAWTELHLDKVLDKKYDGRPLSELLEEPVTALAGVSESDAEHLFAAFGIRTVRDLGSNRYFAVAGVLVALSGLTLGSTTSSAVDGTEEAFAPDPSSVLGVDRISVSVYASVDASSGEWQELEQAALALASSLGYEVDEQLPRIHGSVWDRAFWRRAASNEEVQRLGAKLEQLVDLRLIEKDQASVTGELAGAFERSIKALENTPSACVLIGNLAMIKTSGAKGESRVVARTLSAREMNTLARFPEIQAVPERFLELLSTATAEDDEHY